MLLPKDVNHPPCLKITQHLTLSFADMRCSDKVSGVVHVDIGRRNVVVTSNDNLIGRLGVGIEMIDESLHPRQFVFVMIVL